MANNRDTVLIYTRLHKNIDSAIEKAAAEIHCKKATYVKGIFREYTRKWREKYKDTLPEDKACLGFSPLSPSFFASKGRAAQSALANPMNITLPRKDAELLKSLALKYGYTGSEIRTAILVTYLAENDLLQ